MIKFKINRIDSLARIDEPLEQGRHPQIELAVGDSERLAMVKVNLDYVKYTGRTGLHAEGFLSRDTEIAGATYRQETDVVIDAVGGHGTLTVF